MNGTSAPKGAREFAAKLNRFKRSNGPLEEYVRGRERILGRDRVAWKLLESHDWDIEAATQHLEDVAGDASGLVERGVDGGAAELEDVA